MRKNNKGFSLVELIIVIAIMAVLIAILAPQFIKHVERSRESKDLQNIEEYKTTIEAIAADKEGLDADMQIEIKKTGGSTGGAFINVDDSELSKYGLSTGFELSSDKWDDFTWTYNVTTYSWALDPATADATYFTADGQSK